MAGPIEMPADIAALVALDEVVVHGWDLARATGQPYDPDEASVLASWASRRASRSPPEAGAGPFGPPVARTRLRARPRPARRCHRPRPGLDALTAA